MKYSFALKQIRVLLNHSVKPTLRLCYSPNAIFCCHESNYQSSLSLKNLYPSSSLRLTTPNKILCHHLAKQKTAESLQKSSLGLRQKLTEVPEDPKQKFNGFIPIESLSITYSRSSGPGGQHVNTVNTKVDVRFHVDTAGWLQPDTRSRIADIHKTKINKDGFLIVRSDKTRSQQLNLADCMETLRALVRQAEFRPSAPSPETQEQIRRRKEKANQIRLIEKRSRSFTKASRQAPPL